MSRLPMDSFLPSGALHGPNDHPLSLAGLITSHPSSVISPLSLPRNANQQISYFDDRQLRVGRQPSANAAQAQQGRYLSPHRSPPSSRDQRTASLSPSRQSQQSQNRVGGSNLVSPTLSPLNESAEQASLQLRRVLIQNRRLLENWEAERSHLEANRNRAEEIYKEERAIMDEDRLLWTEKETQYLARIADLEQENAVLRGSLAHVTSHSSRDSAVAGIDGHSERVGISNVKFRALFDSASPIATPTLGLGYTMPESHPFEPLDPRMQGASPQSSTPGDGPESQEIIPSIDVQEVHPDLEGIPLKSTAVKKSTFTDGKPPSPPLSASNATGSNSGSPNSGSRATPAEVTKETLQAPEASRLIMHAGHTPNHSLSTFPTAISTNATNTAGSSGTSTPTHSRSHGEGKGKALAEVEAADGQDLDAADTKASFEPSEGDPELKGPLSLRNQQAFDEIFLGKVADKLQDSIQSDNATPTVLKHDVSEAEPANEPVEPQQTAIVVDHEEDNKAEEPEEVPLKFKSNSNFGAPLGALRGF
ncbi:hypothetical protein SCUP234_01394 [Seiridium cupressi]